MDRGTGRISKRLAKALSTVIINLLIFLTLVGMIEGSVRFLIPGIGPQNLDRSLFDPYKYGQTYGYKPLAKGEEFGALFITDENGFRTSPRSLQRHTSGQIFVLGDSVSVGVGVEAEQTYPSLLEEKLGKKVLNASVTGYALVDYVRVVESTADKFKPELVIIGICLNDVAPTSQANIIAMVQNSDVQGETVPDEKRYPNVVVRTLRYINDNYFNFNNFLKTYSRTYLFLKSFAADTARDYFSADRLYYEDPKTIEFLTSQFAQVKRLLSGSTSLVLVIFPYEYQLRADSLETLEPQNMIREAGRRAGVAIYDLYDGLSEYLKVHRATSKSLYLFNDPMHFNSVGHRAIAELLYGYVNRSD
jgi:lysophospholipase L1-like esterase